MHWAGLTATMNYYGPLTQPFNGNNVLGDYRLDGKALFDLEAAPMSATASRSRWAPRTCSTPIRPNRPMF